MHAWLCEEPVGPAALRWANLPRPEPSPGEVRVAIRAASLNFPDLLIVQGRYQHKPPLPFVPGAELAGIVDAVGAGVEGLRTGDRVAAFCGTGGFATHACVPASAVVPIPPGMDFETAAAFVLTYGTSHHALVDRAALQPHETVLVLGAAGGVGTAAIQIAKAVGARVIAGASSEAKRRRCLELGADAVLDTTADDLRAAIKSLSGDRGPDVVFDPVGGALAEPVFRSIAWRGRHLVIGFAQGGIPALPWNLALLKGASIVGVFWGDFARREPTSNARALAELAAWHAQGLVSPVIHQRLPMTELKQAFDTLARREVIGKLVLCND